MSGSDSRRAAKWVTKCWTVQSVDDDIYSVFIHHLYITCVYPYINMRHT